MPGDAHARTEALQRVRREHERRAAGSCRVDLRRLVAEATRRLTTTTSAGVAQDRAKCTSRSATPEAARRAGARQGHPGACSCGAGCAAKNARAHGLSAAGAGHVDRQHARMISAAHCSLRARRPSRRAHTSGARRARMRHDSHEPRPGHRTCSTDSGCAALSSAVLT